MLVKISFNIILVVLHCVIRHWSAADEAATRNEKQCNLPVLFCLLIANHKYLICLGFFYMLSHLLMHFALCKLRCCRFLVFESVQVGAEGEEQMSKNSPREDRGPSLTSNDNTQNQVESSTAAIENTPEDQVRMHALLCGGLWLF